MKVTFTPPKQQDATQDQGVRVLYAPAKRMAFRLRWYAILLLAFSPVLLLLLYLGRNLWYTQAPGILTTEPQLVVANSDGFVRDVLIAPGQMLNADQPLLRIESPILLASILEQEAQLAQLALDTDAAEQAQLAQLDTQVAIAAEGAREQEKIYQEYVAHKESKLVSSAEFASALLSRTQARLALEEAKGARLVKQQAWQEDRLAGPLVSARNALRQALTRMTATQVQQQPRAPSAGVVADILVQRGDWVFSGTPLALIAKQQQPFILAYIAPKYLAKIQAGASATVVFRSGEKRAATVAREVELTDKLPSQLAEPFEAQRASLKVKLNFTEPLPAAMRIEGLPVMVRLD
ncbi:MAG: HlyD family secretion protein [Aeromonas sp.]